MANITKSVAQYFIPQIWANRALEVLRNQIVMAKLVARDSDVAAFQVGDVLHIPYPGTFSANDKAAGSAVTLQTPSGGSEVQVTLNKHKETSFLIEDVARAEANQDIMDRYLNAAVPAIAETIESDLFALYTGLTTSVGSATLPADITAANIRSARKVMNDNKAPMQGRKLVVSSKDEIALLGDSNLSNYFAFSKTNAIADGALGSLYGFDVYMSQLIPTATGNAIQTLTISGTPTGGTFTLTYSGQTTASIAYNATAATVQSAIAALSNVGTGNVAVSGGPGPGTAWTVAFVGALSGNTTAFTHTDSFTGGSSPALAVAQAGLTSTKNIAFHPEAFILAMRGLPEAPAGSGAVSSTVRDPVSGLVMRATMAYNASYLGVQVTLDVLYGCKVLRDAKAAIVLN